MQLATGLIESTSERAKESASALINQGVEAGSKGPEVVSAQVQEIADDLIEQGRTNRELMVGLIRTEVERAVGRMGFVREEELAAVRKHVERLERKLNQRGDQASAAANLAVSTATSAEALRALAPSTLLQTPYEEEPSMGLLAQLARSLPAYHLNLGADRGVAAIRQVLTA